ncbi:hypothetical protein BGZ76_011777, partial [Entomortierella beljakovae]
SDSTSITPLQPHRLQLIEDGGILPGSSILPATGENPNNLTDLALESHWSMDDADSENAEILSLNSILNQGPEFELQWHAVGQDCDEGFYSYDNINAIASGSGVENTIPINSESGDDPSPPHSRSSTLESVQHSTDSQGLQEPHLHQLHPKTDGETATNPCILTNLGSLKSLPQPSATNKINATPMEIVDNLKTEKSVIRITASAVIAAATPVDITTLSISSPIRSGDFKFNDPSCCCGDASTSGSGAEASSSSSNGSSSNCCQDNHSQKKEENPERPRIHPSQHLQKRSFRTVPEDLTDTEDEAEEGRPKAKDRNKMDIIAALGIADAPDDWEENTTPFSFFNEEPMFHSLSEQSHPNMTSRRYTTDGGSYFHSRGNSHWMDDYYEGVVHLPQDFFEAPKHQFMDSDDTQDGEFDQEGDEGDEEEFIRSRRFVKGKGISASITGFSTATLGSGHSLFNYPVTTAAEEDVAHFTPIPFSDLPSLTNIGLCSHSIVKLSSNIRLLTSATCLQICCNDLSSIPEEIGFLRNLTLLDLSKNSLTALPDSIRFLTKLTDLKLSFNYIESLPPSIGELTKLTTLCLDNNRLTMIPSQIRHLKNLSTLDLDDNPITVLPAEIGQLHYLRRLRLERCPLLTEFMHSPLHSPPTLLELAARVIVRHGVRIPTMLPSHLKSYIRTAQPCSFCSGPYFETSFKRGKMIEKNEVIIPLEYNLCIPHWNTDTERIKLLFGPRSVTAPYIPPPKVSSSPALTSSNTTSNGSRKYSKSESAATINNLTSSASTSSMTPLINQQAASPTTSTTSGSTSALLSSTDLFTEPSSAGNGSCNGSSSNASQLQSLKTRMRSMSRGSSGMTISTTTISSNNQDNLNNTRLSSPPPLTLPQLPSSSSAPKSRFSIRLKSRGERQQSASP